MEVLSDIYTYDNKTKEATLLNEELIKDYRSMVHEKNGLINLFFIYYNADNYSGAEKVLSEIDKVYSNNDEVRLAWWLLGKNSGEPEKSSNIQDINFSSNIPAEYTFYGNYPNPFNPSTSISYSLPYQSSVVLTIYDVMGREIKSFIQTQSAGIKNILWDGTNSNGENVSSGIYIYRLRLKSLETNDKFEKSAKLMLMK